MKQNEILEGLMSRRGMLARVGTAALSVSAAGMLAGCGGNGGSSGGGSTDSQILNAAAIAEALATVMYFNLINGAIYKDLAGNGPDQAYLAAAFEEELNHYNALVSLGAAAVPSGTKFYFPTNMFTDRQTTINTLETLEDAFIAAYLIGVRDFSSNGNKVLAAQIMGVEAEHRTLGRVIANDLGLTYSQGLSGMQESVQAPSHTSNNIAYERTFSAALPNIGAVVKALGPFVTAGSSGFSSTAFVFDSTSMTLPSGVTAVTLDATTP